MELTAGSETSQYREEKKIKIIVKIAASEMTRAQTGVAIQWGCRLKA
jgi:hypothetical protein